MGAAKVADEFLSMAASPNTELTVSSRALDRVRLVVWLLVFRTSPAAQTSRREKVTSCVGCWFEIKT